MAENKIRKDNAGDIDADIKDRFDELKKKAEAGDADAMFMIMNCYRKGMGAEQDIEKEMFWLQKAANCGHDYAQYTLGIAYYNGRGVQQNDEKALYWFEKAAEQGLKNAEFILKGITKKKSCEKSSEVESNDKFKDGLHICCESEDVKKRNGGILRTEDIY